MHSGATGTSVFRLPPETAVTTKAILEFYE